MAHLAFSSGDRRARSALENLRVAYPHLDLRAREAVARASFVNFAWNMLDFVRAEQWDAGEIERHVAIEGAAHLHAALEKGKGALLLTLHMGNFELAALALGLAGFKLLLIVRPFQNPRIYRHVVASRTRFGAQQVNRDGAAGPMLRKLRQNEVVTVLNDQYIRPGRGVFVDLFGVRASTSRGVATLALRSGAPVCPAYTVRDGEDHHILRLMPALETPRTGHRELDIITATAQYNAVLQRLIDTHKEQWMWGHRRFRHSPDLSQRGATPLDVDCAVRAGESGDAPNATRRRVVSIGSNAGIVL